MSEAFVGPYRVIGRLGAGAMGEVFLAEDPRLNRRVALKRLAGVLPDDAESRSRLLAEARAAAGLTHQHIAGVYDVVEGEGGPLIVMEYVEGNGLDEVLKRGPLPVARVVRIGVELADALQAAHTRGVIHRDLKPSNVRLTPEGHVKVLDFGLAHSEREASSAESVEVTRPSPSPGLMAGTPAYMAPEVIRGVAGDDRSDIYSLGVVLFELLAGRRPFTAATPIELMLAVISTPAPDVSDLRPEVPVELSALVARCLARNRDERPASAGAIRQELQRIDHALQRTSSGPTPPVSDAQLLTGSVPVAPDLRSARWRQRAWRGALALALVLAAALALWRADRARQHTANRVRVPVIAVAPLVNVSEDPSLEPLAAGSAVVLISSLGAIPGLQVLSRDATLDYRGAERNLRRLLQDLAPTYAVDATLQRAGDRVRATVNLLDRAGTVAWSGTYDGTLNDPFALQERIADGLAQGLVGLGVVPSEAVASAAPRLHSPPTQDRDAYAYYLQARAFLERPDVPGQLEHAVDLFKRAVERDEQFALAHAGLGEAYWALYQETNDERWPPLAVEAVSRALAIDPALPQVRVSFARILAGSGRLEESLTEVRKALVDAPENDDAHRILGDVLQQTGRTEEALSAYRDAIAHRPNYWRNHSYLGYLLYQTGRYQEAVSAYQRVIELQPDATRGYNALGAIYQSMGRLDAALAQYEKALSLSPSAMTYSNAGTLHYWQGRTEQARAAFAQAIQLAPKRPLFRRNLGDALSKLGRQAEAREAWETCASLAAGELSVNARDTGALAMAAVCEAKLGRVGQARGHIDHALEVTPDDSDTLYNAAVVSALSGRSDEAVQRLVRALDQGYSAVVARHDDELADVRKDPRVMEKLKLGGKEGPGGVR